MKYVLFHAPHTGSQIVLDALQVCRAPLRLIPVDYEKSSKGKDARLKKANPLSRLPTLVLPNRKIMTESGAILLHLAERYPKAGLSPPPRSADHDLFLRLLFIINGEIYPCFTFRDDPSEWVRPVAARDGFAEAVGKHRKELWIYFQSLLPRTGDWALGKRFSAIDLYLASMTTWGPGQDWFRKETPKLHQIGENARILAGSRGSSSST
jgi:GST-like protein